MEHSFSAKPTNRELFVAATHIADVAERQRFLEAACGNDPRRYESIARLLAAREAGAISPLDEVMQFIDPAASELDSAATSVTAGATQARRMIGHFKLLEPIGEGGFGTVYLAEQTTPVRRRVAIKVIKPGMDSKEVIARFEAERQALALMDHPHIARVLDAGTTPQGHPYFAMELVMGMPITEHCDAARLGTRERLKLFVDVCHAVQHAHQKGIIHRDLKPSNVMVTMHDDRAVVKVIDFGVAKALNQQLTDRTLFTSYGQMVGTPRYMSPEQAQLSGLDIDTRSDIFSLGVLLYELLTGTTPFDKETLQRSSFDEIRRLLCEVDPPRPSVRVSTLKAEAMSTLSARQGTDPRKFAATLSGELDWIVMKALEKNRNLRYESASTFASDVERYLADEPVEACPPSWKYRLGKLARRHKAALATATLMLIAIVVGAGVATIQAVRATRAEKLAESRFLTSSRAARREAEARQEAEQLTSRTRRLLAQSYVATGVARLAENDLARSLPWFVAALEEDVAEEQSAVIHRTRLGMVLQQCPKLTALFDTGFTNPEQMPARFDQDDRPLAVRLTASQAQVFDVFADRSVGPAFTADAHLTRASLSPDCRYVIVGGGSKDWLWEVATGRQILEFERSLADTYCFSPAGDRLALIRRDGPEGYIWETRTGRLIHSPKVSEHPASKVSFDADGEQLVWAISRGDRHLSIWNAATGTELHPLREHLGGISSVAFNHAGTRLITSSYDSTACLWDTATMSPVGKLHHADCLQQALFSRDDSLVATISEDCTARLWDPETGRPTSPPLEHDGVLIHAAFSDDGRYLVTTSWDNTARVWDTASGKLGYPILMHHTQVVRAAFDSQARQVLTVTSDGLMHVWDLASASPPGVLIDHHGPGFNVHFSPDSQTFLGADKAARLWDAQTGKPLSKLLSPLESVNVATFSPTGKRIATRGSGGVQVFDATTLRPISTSASYHAIEAERSARGLSFGFEERSILALFRLPRYGGVLRIYDADTGQDRAWPVADSRRVLSASFSPDGRLIATGCANSDNISEYGGTLQFWNGTDGTPLGDPIAHRYPVCHVLFSSDNRRMITVSAALYCGRGEVRCFDVATRAQVGTPIHVGSEFTDADLSPDGTRVAVTARDETARVWDLETGKPKTPPMRHRERLQGVRFSPDGRLIVTTTGSENQNSHMPANMHLWDATTGQLVSPPLRHSEPDQVIESATFSPDGRWMGSVSRDGTTRIWAITSKERPVEAWKLITEVLSSRRVERSGALSSLSREEKLAAWRFLRADHAELVTASPQQLVAWHHAEALSCMETRRWAEAITHLDPVIVQLPDEHIGIRQRRAYCAAMLGRWSDAFDDLESALDSGWISPDCHDLALLALKLNDASHFRATCDAMLTAYADSNSAYALRSTASAVSLAGNVYDDYAAPLRLARRAVELDPNEPICRIQLGKVLYRAGEWEEALAMLSAETNAAIVAVTARYFLAMTHHKLGDNDEARATLARANDAAAKVLENPAKQVRWSVPLMLELLRSEAVGLIATPASPGELPDASRREGDEPQP